MAFRACAPLLCEAKRQYLLTCKVSRYCLLVYTTVVAPSDDVFVYLCNTPATVYYTDVISILILVFCPLERCIRINHCTAADLFDYIFRHLKLEIASAIPASNDEK